MSDRPPEPQQPNLSEKIADILIKLIATGSGGYSLYSLVTDDILKAAIAAVVAFGTGLIANFGAGFGGILNPGAKKAGEIAGETVKETVTGLASQITDFPSLYREAVKTYCSAVEVEGFQSLPGLPLKDVFISPPSHLPVRDMTKMSGEGHLFSRTKACLVEPVYGPLQRME